MRIDKFLKIALLFKTRSSAEKVIEEQGVFINGKPAKPSTAVREGDLLVIRSLDREVTYRVKLLLEKNVSRQMAKEMVELVREEQIDDF